MDERQRKLERAAKSGDAQAAEQLYWDVLRSTSITEILDRLIETALTRGNQLPSVWEKLAWLRSEAPALTEEDLGRLRRTYSRVPDSQALHRIPRQVRQPGFTTYCASERQVYRVRDDGQWQRIADLSDPPPGMPFTVFATIAARDAAGNPDVGASCLVLENGGVYQARSSRSAYQPHRNEWASIRFERTRP